ncbi:Protein kinase [Quillaja saponaria]|uniref:Protein kinase n=1 Tax=Quillaja saponaria TaxID=32244 RepID=A0AAD7KRE8_QUISA|nr:Protein kinase [Quillaja saponaria]
MREIHAAWSFNDLMERAVPYSNHNSWKADGLMADNDGGDFEEPFVFDIHPSLLVDSSNVTLGRKIGKGSHSKVYEGEFESQPVAVKVIGTRTSEASRDLKENFEREVNLLSMMEHDNIVKFVGATVEPDMMIITELMRGGSLQQQLWGTCPTTLDLELSISFALDISRVMEYLHGNGIIHRDLNPGNILLTEDKKQVKLADFGLARGVIPGEMTSDAGTYRWMAPELFNLEPIPKGAKSKKFYDHKADVYSFSILLWTLLTKKIPFRGNCSMVAAYAMANNQRPSVDDVPSDIIPLLESCWAANPRDRPDFVEITGSLTTFFHNFCSSVTPPSNMIENGGAVNNMGSGFPRTCPVKTESKEKRRKRRWPIPSFLKCFKFS